MESQTSPSVAAVVVHYRTPAKLAACLHALSTQTYAFSDVLVIDNSLPDGDADELPEPSADWRLHRMKRNVGFGSACNVGARETASDYILFLNADLTLCDTACQELCATAEANPGAAVLGPRIYGSNGDVELSARSFPSFWTGVWGRSSFATRLLRRAGTAPSALSTALSADTTAVDWVSGACMMVRRQAFADVGGFDEGYWMYWEDADLCRRLGDQGWKTMYCAEAECRHQTGSSGRSVQTVESFHVSAARYYQRHLARNTLDAWLARTVLNVRMKIVLRGHFRKA